MVLHLDLWVHFYKWCEKMFWFHSFIYTCSVFPVSLTFLHCVYSCSVCSRLIDCKCIGLSLGLLPCYTDPYAFFSVCNHHTIFDYCSFVVQSEVRKRGSSSSSLLSQDCFSYLRSFVLPKFEICFVLVPWKMPLVIQKRLKWICRLPGAVWSF